MSAALIQSLGELTAKIISHSENLLTDYQPYDLHQFRVNMRRTRSLLKQMRNSPAAYFRKSWGGIFAVTNQARDLDVFLESSRMLLPAEQFRLFEQLLLPRIRTSHDAVAELLQSRHLKRHMAGWRGFLITLENRQQEISQGRLSKAMKRARKARRKALAADDDYTWHRFRIAVKNLRYVADSSRNDPGSDMVRLDALIEECKALQTLLGDWHDTIVQLRLIGQPALSALLEADPELIEVRAGLEAGIRQRKYLLLAQTRSFIAETGLFDEASGQAPA